MNRGFKTLLFLFPILLSCKEQPSNWDNPDIDPKTYEPNSLRIENYSIKGVPFKTDRETILKVFGAPDTIFYHDSVLISKSERVSFESFRYYDGSLGFYVYKNYATVSYIHFKDTDLEITVKEQILSSSTRFKLTKSIFPKSYAWRNPGIPHTMDFIIDDLEKYRDFQFIHIDDGVLKTDYYGIVELAFIDGKLAMLQYIQGT